MDFVFSRKEAFREGLEPRDGVEEDRSFFEEKEDDLEDDVFFFNDLRASSVSLLFLG